MSKRSACGLAMILEQKHVLEFSVPLKINVPFPPRVDDVSNLRQRLMLEISVAIRRFDHDFVSAVAGCHLKHSDSSQINLREDAEGGKLVRNNTSQPTGGVSRFPVFSYGEDLGRSLVFAPGAEWTPRTYLGCLLLSSRLGGFRSLSAR